jgi:D-arginine dehydrogenase
VAGVDVLIVGGGIGGASLGAELAGRCSVLLVEAESQCGVHATGRSAAFWLETYGGPIVAQLSAASRGFLAEPPGDFAEHGFLTTRGALHVARNEAELPELSNASAVGRDELEALVPGIRSEWTCALLEPAAPTSTWPDFMPRICAGSGARAARFGRTRRWRRPSMGANAGEPGLATAAKSRRT